VTADPFGPHALAVVAVTGLIVVACVLLHYEGSVVLTRALARMHVRVRRRRLLALVFGLLALHIAEIWLFAVSYYGLASAGDIGYVGGTAAPPGGTGLLDLVYFSAVVYSTLGLGDLVPLGPIRFMAGTESLSGFLLISWSASLLYLEMARFWKTD
jgi:hypothetical protein